jgi:hypothetical protein
MDMTWLAKGGELPVNLMTHVTVVWELTYIVLIWPRLTRPIMLALAVPLHLGIAFCMGMMTFGLAMLIGNLAFVSPWVIRALLDRRTAATADIPTPALVGAGRGTTAVTPRKRGR